MIEKAEAIVLKSKKYGDTSKIITLYTREFGKISVIAKGSRSKNNRFGGSLEPLSHISIVFYNYKNRDLQYITQSSILNYFPNNHNEFSKLTTCLAITEIINNVIHHEERSDEFFNLIVNTFQAIENSDKDVEIFLVYFELNLAGLLGFNPTFDYCGMCKTPLDSSYLEPIGGFNMENGGILCKKCFENSIFPLKKISLQNIRILQNFTKIDPFEVKKIPIQTETTRELFFLMNSYLKRHLEGMRTLKSLEIFSKFQ